MICLPPIKVAISHHIKEENKNTSGKEGQNQNKNSGNTEYSGETARAWLLSELFDIHHRVTFVNPKLQYFLTGRNGWPERIKRIYWGILKNENVNAYLVNTLHQIKFFRLSEMVHTFPRISYVIFKNTFFVIIVKLYRLFNGHKFYIKN